MTPADWHLAFGPLDGPWLLAELARLTDAAATPNALRCCRIDDAPSEHRYHGAAAVGTGVPVEYQVASPHTGREYVIGWHLP